MYGSHLFAEMFKVGGWSSVLKLLVFCMVKTETKPEATKESKEDLRAKLAAEAKRTGVMQAAPGTEQGKTGWYIDSDGQLTSWLVSASGEWTRMS